MHRSKDQSQALASNLYLLLYAKAGLQAALRAHVELYGAVFAALREIEAGAFLREGRVYGGALYKMEPKELARLSEGKRPRVLLHGARLSATTTEAKTSGDCPLVPTLNTRHLSTLPFHDKNGQFRRHCSGRASIMTPIPRQKYNSGNAHDVNVDAKRMGDPQETDRSAVGHRRLGGSGF
jgi:hypothetical protein